MEHETEAAFDSLWKELTEAAKAGAKPSALWEKAMRDETGKARFALLPGKDAPAFLPEGGEEGITIPAKALAERIQLTGSLKDPGPLLSAWKKEIKGIADAKGFLSTIDTNPFEVAGALKKKRLEDVLKSAAEFRRPFSGKNSSSDWYRKTAEAVEKSAAVRIEGKEIPALSVKPVLSKDGRMGFSVSYTEAFLASTQKTENLMDKVGLALGSASSAANAAYYGILSERDRFQDATAAFNKAREESEKTMKVIANSLGITVKDGKLEFPSKEASFEYRRVITPAKKALQKAREEYRNLNASGLEKGTALLLESLKETENLWREPEEQKAAYYRSHEKALQNKTVSQRILPSAGDTLIKNPEWVPDAPVYIPKVRKVSHYQAARESAGKLIQSLKAKTRETFGRAAPQRRGLSNESVRANRMVLAAITPGLPEKKPGPRGISITEYARRAAWETLRLYAKTDRYMARRTLAGLRKAEGMFQTDEKAFGQIESMAKTMAKDRRDPAAKAQQEKAVRIAKKKIQRTAAKAAPKAAKSLVQSFKEGFSYTASKNRGR